MKTIFLKGKKLTEIEKDNIAFQKQTERILKKAIMERRKLQEEEIKTIHVLLSILLDQNNIISICLNQLNLTYETIIEEYESDLNIDFKHDQGGEIDDNEDVFGPSNPEKPKSGSKTTTPVLDNFGRDLTQYAKEGKLDPIVGRHKEIERVSQILSRRKKE